MDCLVLACKMTQKPSRVDRSREYPPSPYTHTQSGTLTLPSDLFTPLGNFENPVLPVHRAQCCQYYFRAD